MECICDSRLLWVARPYTHALTDKLYRPQHGSSCCMLASNPYSMNNLMKQPSAQMCESSIMHVTNGTPFCAKQAIFKAFVHNYRAKTGLRVDR